MSCEKTAQLVPMKMRMRGGKMRQKDKQDKEDKIVKIRNEER